MTEIFFAVAFLLPFNLRLVKKNPIGLSLRTRSWMCHFSQIHFSNCIARSQEQCACIFRPTYGPRINRPAPSLTHAYLHKNELGAHAPDDLPATLHSCEMMVECGPPSQFYYWEFNNSRIDFGDMKVFHKNSSTELIRNPYMGLASHSQTKVNTIQPAIFHDHKPYWESLKTCTKK